MHVVPDGRGWSGSIKEEDVRRYGRIGSKHAVGKTYDCVEIEIGKKLFPSVAEISLSEGLV